MNQQTLRKKLQSTKNIQHITEAIELVSGVKFKKLMVRMEHFRLYANKLSEMVENLSSETGASHPFFVPHAKKHKAVIILSSDKGLSGAYNSNLFRKADRFLAEQPPETELILFGQKAQDHYARARWKIRESHVHYAQHLKEEQIKEWCSAWSQAFIKEEFDELWIVYTKFKNVLSKEPVAVQILPLVKSTPTQHMRSNYIFEPSPEALYENIIPFSFYTKMHALILETQASELASRILSMKAATKNAEELIKKLTLIKNKVRQFGITREILEINAGAQELA